MADSTKFSQYHLTGWNIDDDSLSYIDHDYWKGLLDQIVASRWGRKASNLDRDKMFHKAFDRINKPRYDSDAQPRHYSNYSEAQRFKLMIEKIWDISAGRDRGRTLYREGERKMARDSADEKPNGKDFGNTVCSMPSDARGFFSFVVETLNAAQEYASKRRQVLAHRQSLATNLEEGRSKETSSFAPKEMPSAQKRQVLGQAVSIPSSRVEHSRENSSFGFKDSASRQEELIIGDATPFSSNIAGLSIKEELKMDQPMTDSSKGFEHSIVEQSYDDSSASVSTAFELSEHSIELGEVVEQLATSLNGLEHLAVEQPKVCLSASMSISSDSSENSDVDHSVPMPIAPDSSEQPDSDGPRSMLIESDPLGHSLQSREVTGPIALAPNRLEHSIGPYHPSLVGIDITGHGSFLIKRAFFEDKTELHSAFGASLNILCTQSKDYIVCGLKNWEKGGHVEGQLALDIVGVWLEKTMRQFSCQSLISFIHELGAGQQLDLWQLHRAVGGFSLLDSRSRFDLVPGDAAISHGPQKVSHKSSSHRHLLQITNQNITGKFIGLGGASAREVEKILGLCLYIKQFNGEEYIVCKPCAHQILDRQEKVNRERCRIGLEIITIWIWEHWNPQNEYIDLPGFLVCLRASNDKMTLEDIYKTAVQSMRRTRLPYAHKTHFESKYTIEAE